MLKFAKPDPSSTAGPCTAEQGHFGDELSLSQLVGRPGEHELGPVLHRGNLFRLLSNVFATNIDSVCNLNHPPRAAAQGRFGGGLRLLHLRPLVPGEPDIGPDYDTRKLIRSPHAAELSCFDGSFHLLFIVRPELRPQRSGEPDLPPPPPLFADISCLSPAPARAARPVLVRPRADPAYPHARIRACRTRCLPHSPPRGRSASISIQDPRRGC